MEEAEVTVGPDTDARPTVPSWAAFLFGLVLGPVFSWGIPESTIE